MHFLKHHDELAAAIRSLAKQAGIEHSQARVLVLGHDDDVSRLVDKALSDAEYKPRVLTHPRYAVSTAKRIGAKAIVINLEIDPQLIALSVLDRLRADPVTAAMPIILCAREPLLQYQRCVDDKRLRLLLVPFTPEDLVAAVDRAIDELSYHPRILMLNLSAVLEQHTRRRPDAEALVYGDKRLTYAQLNAWANQIANALAASGIRRGDHVALLCPNLPYFPAVYFGILKAGATVVPLNVLLKPREIAYHLRDSDAKAMFCFQGTPELPMAEAAKAAIAVVPACKTLIVLPHPSIPLDPAFDDGPEVIPLARFIGGQPPVFETVQTKPDDTAIILYTSGTTGQPKGAELTHLNMVVNGMVSAELCASSHDENGRHATAITLPLFHATAQTAQMLAYLPPGRHARAAAALRSGGAADDHDVRAHHALDRRADDVLDAAEVCARAGHRRVADGGDAAAGGVGRRAHAGRADERFREDLRRPHHRRLRPVGDVARRELQSSRTNRRSPAPSGSRCLPSTS